MMVIICAKKLKIFNKVKGLWRTYNLDLGIANWMYVALIPVHGQFLILQGTVYAPMNFFHKTTY
jgi:hypothetical protein